jgi:hypothetical protein
MAHLTAPLHTLAENCSIVHVAKALKRERALTHQTQSRACKTTERHCTANVHLLLLGLVKVHQSRRNTGVVSIEFENVANKTLQPVPL